MKLFWNESSITSHPSLSHYAGFGGAEGRQELALPLQSGDADADRGTRRGRIPTQAHTVVMAKCM